jgi:hypothetical protein
VAIRQPSPGLIAMADNLDAFGVEAHRRRIGHLRSLLVAAADLPSKVTGLIDRDIKPSHTTTFEHPVGILESRQSVGSRGGIGPVRGVRSFRDGVSHRADYEESDTDDTMDSLTPGSAKAAIALCDRFDAILAVAETASDDAPRIATPAMRAIVSGLASFLAFNGMKPPTGDIQILTGRPYGLPVLRSRPKSGTFEAVADVSAEELQWWLPPTVGFHSDHVSSFRRVSLTLEADRFDWNVDAVALLRAAAAAEEARRAS